MFKFWRKPKVAPPEIPPSPHWHIKVMPDVEHDSGMVVEELDASDVDIKELQSRTGMFRVFKRKTGG
jgi:hypothetical protein